MVNFQVFPDSAYQAELERYQGHLKLDDKYQLHGAHGRLNYDLHDKNWIPHIGINNPSNCKADTKSKDIKKKHPTTRTQATIVWFPRDTCTTFQVSRIHARIVKVHQKHFNESIPYNRVNPEKIRQNNNRYNNINNIKNKLTNFHIYPETELARKYTTPFYQIQYSKNLVKYKQSFDMNPEGLIINPNPMTFTSNNDKNSYIQVTFLKNTGRSGGKL